ncbi:MAG: hypothetical protein EOP45_20735 [Sphingobacteriaceae bacterium]|nr:MAG: hypothetical protein EOP45_20735 [Sphingobacteriaceae bacterium]
MKPSVPNIIPPMLSWAKSVKVPVVSVPCTQFITTLGVVTFRSMVITTPATWLLALIEIPYVYNTPGVAGLKAQSEKILPPQLFTMVR